jgi:hypothetical protein
MAMACTWILGCGASASNEGNDAAQGSDGGGSDGAVRSGSDGSARGGSDAGMHGGDSQTSSGGDASHTPDSGGSSDAPMLDAAGPPATFDYYVAPNGDDSNHGTLASPWAITAINTKQSTYAGKRVGLLPGTYDVSSLMKAMTSEDCALQINGGPNQSTPTYIASSNASGAYQRGTAIIDAKGAVGQYGGGNSISPYVMGQSISLPNMGNWTLDGLNFTGFANWAVSSGNDSGSPTGTPIPNTIVQNCSFYGSLSTTTTTHPAPVMFYSYNNARVSNCWFYDNANPTADSNHYSSINAWGFGTSSGLVIEKCTFVNSPGIYCPMDNGPQQNITIQQDYWDFTTAGSNFALRTAILGMAPDPSIGGGNQLTLGSVVRNNIVRGGSVQDSEQSGDWYTPFAYYNNTWDLAGTHAGGLGFRNVEAPGYSGLMTSYNNLMYDSGFTGFGSGQYGYQSCSINGFALCDYNIYGSAVTGYMFSTYGSGGGGSGEVVYGSLAAWKAAISTHTPGAEAHSSTNSANPFTNNGANALQYQISPGSPAYQTGRVGGVASGAPCNVGAWDGTVTQIGCSFAD